MSEVNTGEETFAAIKDALENAGVSMDGQEARKIIADMFGHETANEFLESHVAQVRAEAEE